MKEWKKAEECEKDMKQAEYKASRNEAKRCIARVQAETSDSKEGRQNIFRIAKQKKKERKDITGTKCLKGDNGELLVSKEQVSGRWREYFENEWNDELSAEYVEGPADMISKEEVRQAIQDLKVKKAAGSSGVTAEMIKAAGEQAVDWLTILKFSLTLQVTPFYAEDWQTAGSQSVNARAVENISPDNCTHADGTAGGYTMPSSVAAYDRNFSCQRTSTPISESLLISQMSRPASRHRFSRQHS